MPRAPSIRCSSIDEALLYHLVPDATSFFLREPRERLCPEEQSSFFLSGLRWIDLRYRASLYQLMSAVLNMSFLLPQTAPEVLMITELEVLQKYERLEDFVPSIPVWLDSVQQPKDLVTFCSFHCLK
ncbi:hypothetical protein HAX54_029614 [Datura stramonium]|uniref:Uncharacterized protein n=1 Tax=Datura stramonium TaxID=4076 RepID=A0ABS8V8N8_DATST|nr:hypothetical protein [Datura stramonium]